MTALILALIILPPLSIALPWWRSRQPLPESATLSEVLQRRAEDCRAIAMGAGITSAMLAPAVLVVRPLWFAYVVAGCAMIASGIAVACASQWWQDSGRRI